MAKKKTLSSVMPQKVADGDTWMFNKDGSKLFLKGSEIPAGYVDSPAKVK